MAVVTALGFSTIRRRFVVSAILGVLGAWTVVQFAGLTFGLRGSLLPSRMPVPPFTRIGKRI